MTVIANFVPTQAGIPCPRIMVTGARSLLAVLMALAPLELAVGATAAEADLSNAVGWFISWMIYGGPAQVAFIRAMESGTAAAIVVLTVMAVNLRMVFYSLNMAPPLVRRIRSMEGRGCLIHRRPIRRCRK